MLASSLRSTSLAEAQARAAKLKLMVFDVDGVLTDGSLFYTDEGVQLKAFNSEGYFFDADASEKGELVFKRHEQ